MIIRICLSILVLIIAVPVSAQTVPESREQVQLSFAPLVKKVAPAVVNIHTKRTVSKRSFHPFMNDPFFSQFFGNRFGGRMRRQVESALGSGVIIQKDGLVVTNAHVIKGADEITVVLSDGREFEADLALKDEPSDLALLRMQTKGEDLPHAPLKPSETLEVGDLVLAIGNPFAVGQTVTSGIVSAKARSSLNINDFNFFIQTDAAINPGNSGGPLVALDGGVVGINTAIYSRDGGSLGIGFAIPSEMVATVIAAEQMGRTGEEGVVRPWLGVTTQNVTAEIAESLGMEKPLGALVKALHPASPLATEGIEVGDVILKINSHEVRDASELKFRMATVPLGQRAIFETVRRGQAKSYEVKAIAPPDDPPRDETVLEGTHPLRGVTIANLNPALIVELGSDEDEGPVVLDVPRNLRIARVLKPGDVLQKINGIPVKDVKDVQKAIARRAPQRWSVVVKARGQTRQILLN